jgi:hypothetical protein
VSIAAKQIASRSEPMAWGAYEPAVLLVGDTGPLGAASPAGASWPILAMMDYLRLLRTM